MKQRPITSQQRTGRPCGFTAVEVLVVLAVVAVLAGIAGPSLGKWVQVMRMRSVANEFLASLYLARSEAVKRNTRVALCKSADGTRCASTGGWDQGWIIFHDPNNNGSADAGEAIVRRRGRLPAGFRLTGNQQVARYISFSPLGGTRSVSGAYQIGTISLCWTALPAIEGRAVVINNMGRMRVEVLPPPNCA